MYILFIGVYININIKIASNYNIMIKIRKALNAMLDNHHVYLGELPILLKQQKIVTIRTYS